MILLEEFDAQSDSGKIYAVQIWQEEIDASSMSSGRKKILGMKQAMLSDGSHVNVIDSETFEIVDTGEIIRKIE